MSKIFPHRARKLRSTDGQSQPRGSVIAEDPLAHRLRVGAERRERQRIEAGRRERMLQRREARRPSIGDAEWFAAHPGREHTVRRSIKGEIPPQADDGQRCRWVAVRQITPNLRIHIPFYTDESFTRQILDAAVADEVVVKRVFDLADATPPGTRPPTRGRSK